MKPIAFSTGSSRWWRSRKRLIFTTSQIKDYMVSLVSDSFNYFSPLRSLDSLIWVSLQLTTWSEKPSRMTAFTEADNVAQKCRDDFLGCKILFHLPLATQLSENFNTHLMQRTRVMTRVSTHLIEIEKM